MNVLGMRVFLLFFVVLSAGCTINGQLWDFNSLTPPFLTDSEGNKLESFVINSKDPISQYPLKGECFYEGQRIDVTIAPLTPVTSSSDEKKIFRHLL